MSKMSRTLPILPTEIQTLSGTQLPIFSQLPKGIQEYPTSNPRQAIKDNKRFTWCPFCGGWVEGAPLVENSLDAPKITHKTGATVYRCRRCNNVLATVGTPLYNTGIGQNVVPSSNTGRVTSRE